jgi:predicted ATPase/DNA-binding SARP family transcriptional activator
VRFGILGETRASRADGATAGLGGPGRRALLAMLLLEAGRTVTVERLIDGLHGEDPPVAAGNALQSQVSRLRSALRLTIDSHPGGYRLVVDPDEVDAHRFEKLAAQGRTALSAGDPARAAGLLREALALWRGPALADVGDAPFAGPQVARLEELRITAIEDRVAAELALDAHHHRELVAELRELVAAHPLRERLRAQLMRALQRCGRPAEALRVYEDARRELAETLGTDPGPELAEVHLAVLRGNLGRPVPGPPGAVPPGAGAGAGVSTPPAPAPALPSTPGRGDVSRETTESAVSRETAAVPQRPPAQLTSFVGRAEELARIRELLRGGRLVTLLGPGGAGKTRLSIEAAERYTGEVCFVDLSGLTDAAGVPQALLVAFGLREAGLIPGAGPVAGPTAETGSDAVPAKLAAALAGRPLLLVLDNCEHVIAEVAAVAARLLADCPLLRILATSREVLGVTGEALCVVQPLPLPPPGSAAERARDYPAVRLFAARAAAVRPGFDLDADLDAVLRVCAALDGLPLAIELAAARLRSLAAAVIAEKLESDQRFRLLSRGSRTARPRQQTLRGVVDWSWDLLEEAERIVLRRASVFAGGWTLEAAEAVCADGDRIGGDDVLDLVEALVDKSLVTADGDGRHRMLQTIRAYAAEKLDEAGEAEPVRRVHATYFLDLARAADPHLRSAEQLDWLGRLAADHDNLHAALGRVAEAGDTDTGLRLLAALTTYWVLRGMRYEGERPARRLLAATGPRPPEGLDEEYVLCVMAAAAAAPDQNGLSAHLAAAGEVMDALGSLPRRHPVLSLLWAPFAGVPDPDTYNNYLEAVLTLSQDPWQHALAHVGTGFQRWLTMAEYDAAEEEFARAATAFRDLGDRWGTTIALTQLAWLAGFRGDVARAVAVIGEALATAEELGATENVAELLYERGRCVLWTGNPAAARADFERSAELARRTGARELLAGAYLGLGECARLLGDLGEARSLCEQALSECMTGWYSGEGTRAEILIALGRIAEAEGDRERARALYRQASDSEYSARNLPLAAALADAFAGLALLDGAPERAAQLLGLARALRGREALTSPDVARTVAAARARLGGPAYDAAHARGTALGVDDAWQALQALAGR